MNKIILTLFLIVFLPQFSCADSVVPLNDLNYQRVRMSISELQHQLNTVRQKTFKSDNDEQLKVLQSTVNSISVLAGKLLTDLEPERERIQAQINVLGTQSVLMQTESVDLVVQREFLNNTLKEVIYLVHSAQEIKQNAINLEVQITALRNITFKSHLAVNSGSVLWFDFWSGTGGVISRYSELFRDMTRQIINEWEERRYYSVLLFPLSVLFFFLGRVFFEWCAVSFSICFIPDSRLRRSFMSLMTVVATLVAAILAMNTVKHSFHDVRVLSQDAKDVVAGLVRIGIFCSLLSGLNRAFFSVSRPSWRLIQVDDNIAGSVSRLLSLFIFIIFIFGVTEAIGGASDIGVKDPVQAKGLVTILSMLILSFILIYVHRAHSNAPSIERPAMMGWVQLLIAMSVIVVLFLLLAGYVVMAHFLTYKIFWITLVVSVFYLSSVFAIDVITAVFSPCTFVGNRMKNTLNVTDRNLEQLTIIVIAAVKCFLILLMVAVLANGSFGTTTLDHLLMVVFDVINGNSLERLNIVPGNLIDAIICFVVGMYVLYGVRRWLGHELLPKIINDDGIRTSLITLFNNVGYVLLFLLTLATLGVKWSSLTWVVSALSVGIGFGLQEIVKNFISGLILLTERPVKVGDMVSIGGIEGDVRKISVRATEIQLSDRSTVIVPNSQLISQSVRNATMGNAQGVVTITLTFPIDTQPELARIILINSYKEHEAILGAPPPNVRFGQISSEGFTLNVTGYVSSPRIVGSTRSDLLFSILMLLHESNISLSKPKEFMLSYKEDNVNGSE